MHNYKVFYRTNPNFRPFTSPSRVAMEVVTGEYHLVTEFEADSIGTVYRDMNAVDGNEHVCELRVRSMSVGDLVLETDTEKLFYCDPFGWAPVDSPNLVATLASMVKPTKE